MTGFVYILPAVAGVLAAMLAGAALFTKLPTRQLTFFGLLNIGSLLWANGHFLRYTIPVWTQPGPPRLATAAAMYGVAQLGAAMVATYWFAFAAETTGRSGLTRGWRGLLMHAPGALLLAALVTNEWHHLFADSLSASPDAISYGPLGLVAFAGVYALTAASALLYLHRPRGERPLLRPVRYPLAVCSLLLLAANVAWTTRWLNGLPLRYNPTILLLPLVNVTIALLVLRTDLLDLVPTAETHAFHWMADAGIVLTPAGRVVALNQAARRMVPHVKRGEVLADDAPELAADVARLAEGYTDRPHGADAWWLRVVPMRAPSGRRLGLLVLLTDVGEKRAFEQRIVELNRDLRHTVLELETATRAKDRFIANASHELRTPLQSVIGYTQRLLFERVGPLHKAQRDELEIVERSARHLLVLIESLLDIAHLGSGEVRTDALPFDPAVTAQQVIEAIEPLATAKGLRLSLSCAEFGEIVGDETKLRQILLNLVANAVKFTREGEVTLTGEQEDGWAVFRVRDTGPGIPPEELQRIFEAFHRVRTRTAEGAGGSGLGLHVSQVLATMLGGRLEVESEVGEGSTFTLFLPAETACGRPHEGYEPARDTQASETA